MTSNIFAVVKLNVSHILHFACRFVEESMPAGIQAPEESKRRTDVLLYRMVSLRLYEDVAVGHAAAGVGYLPLRRRQGAFQDLSGHPHRSVGDILILFARITMFYFRLPRNGQKSEAVSRPMRDFGQAAEPTRRYPV